MRPKARWISSEEWTCSVHVPTVIYAATVSKCWYVNCSVRPEKKGKFFEDKTPDVSLSLVVQNLCAWENCDKGLNGVPEFARRNSKYCSRDCSNKNARSRYKKRNRKKAA